MFANALKIWTTTYGRIWSECAVSKCPWSTTIDVNSTSLQQNNNKDKHRDATIRSIFSQIDPQRNHSHAPHDLLSAKYTRNRHKTTHTHMPPSGQSSLRSIFNAIIHMRHTTYMLQNTHAIESKPHTPPPSDVCKCLQDMNDDLRQYLKWMNSLQRSLMPLIQRSK